MYYLTEDIDGSIVFDNGYSSGTFYLCLNGRTITAAHGAAEWLKERAKESE